MEFRTRKRRSKKIRTNTNEDEDDEYESIAGVDPSANVSYAKLSFTSDEDECVPELKPKPKKSEEVAFAACPNVQSPKVQTGFKDQTSLTNEIPLIPDRSTILEIKKTRERIRRKVTAEFIPVEDWNRLVEDEVDERVVEIEMIMDKQAKERQAVRDNFLYCEQKSSDDSAESDEEFQRWEREQIMKGVGACKRISSFEHFITPKIKEEKDDDPISHTNVKMISLEDVERVLCTRIESLSNVFNQYQKQLDSILRTEDSSRNAAMHGASCKEENEEKYRELRELRM
ncbi:hypothetical protein ACOME3_008138 [Neoechinorhynchus agilis]